MPQALSRRLPVTARRRELHERAKVEWSLVETRRPLLFSRDVWLGKAVLEEEAPYQLRVRQASGVRGHSIKNHGPRIPASIRRDARRRTLRPFINVARDCPGLSVV
ncbi:MAG: hypothetical protein H6526_10010 [Actinobacteria bacterium]|nr:hypothetical protein [Actinomycetota bacterium]